MRNPSISRGPVRLAAATWGDPRRPPLVLVHGYPDSKLAWRPVAERLADRFYVIAYDVRGAGESSRPGRVRDYAMAELNADFTAVVDALAPGRPVHVAGHDWGAIQSWSAVAALQHEGRIASFTAISGPGLDYVAASLRDRIGRPSLESAAGVLSQAARSWYVAAFQVPLLAPAVWRAGLGKRWRGILRRLENLPENAPYPPADITDEGAYGVNLYRANIGPRMAKPRPVPVTVRVQIVLPAGDPFVDPMLYDGLEQWVPDLTRTRIDGGHWCIVAQPGEMAETIARFALAV